MKTALLTGTPYKTVEPFPCFPRKRSTAKYEFFRQIAFSVKQKPGLRSKVNPHVFFYSMTFQFTDKKVSATAVITPAIRPIAPYAFRDSSSVFSVISGILCIEPSS